MFRNLVSLFGFTVAMLATTVGLPAMCIDLISRRPHQPYLAVLIYLTLPLIAMGGVALAVTGALWERHRRRRHPERVPSMPRLDLNLPKHQAIVAGGLFTVMLIMVLLAVTGYQAYHFTESVKFCGLVCHKVMKPEYTAYQHSPHARVACIECHVGSGADWYVRSKLNGLYQVYSMATNRYPKPVPTPVRNLRPAQDTCEQCHWPSQAFGPRYKTFSHFLADEQNTPWQIQMLVNVGGGDPKAGTPEGIHGHMNVKNEIQYIAADAQRQVIPWVRSVGPDGTVTEYQSTEQSLTPEQIAAAVPRRMDCVDCHSRPSHIFRPPDEAVDEALAAGRLDPSLPYLKREAVRLLAATYETESQAKSAIPRDLAAFYAAEYPEVARENMAQVRSAGEEVTAIFAHNVFPEMKTDWRAHPDFAGHLTSDGCFRCHDGQHRSVDGRVITKDCNACHAILAQGPPAAAVAAAAQPQAFQHPVDVGVDVTEYKCSQCHTGTSGL